MSLVDFLSHARLPVPGYQAVELLVPKLLAPQLPGYWVIVAEASHNCSWLNVWLVELWLQVQLRVGRNYSIRSSRIAGQSHSSRSRCIANWIYGGKSGNSRTGDKGCCLKAAGRNR